MLKPPPAPTGARVAAAVLLVLLVVVALLGIGAGGSGGLPRGAVRVAGKDPAGGSVIRLDLSKPIAVVVGSGAAPGATRAKLSLQAFGEPVSQSTASLHPFGTGQVASLDASGSRYVAGGRFQAQLQLLAGTRALAHSDFGVQTQQFGLLSAAGAVVILLLLFALAYAESFIQALHKNRKRTTGLVGLALMGVLVGVAAVGLAWVLAIRVPTVATAVVAALLGAGAGVALGLAARQVGLRRRFDRARHRASTAA